LGTGESIFDAVGDKGNNDEDDTGDDGISINLESQKTRSICDLLIFADDEDKS